MLRSRQWPRADDGGGSGRFSRKAPLRGVDGPAQVWPERLRGFVRTPLVPGITNQMVRGRAGQPEDEREREERRQQPEGAGETDRGAHGPHPQRAAADAGVDGYAPDPAHAGGPSMAGPAQHADKRRGLDDPEG